MTESEFDRLIALYRQNKLPESQRNLVDKWLEMKTEYKDTHTLSDARIAEMEAQLLERIENAGRQRKLFPVWLKAAAAILVVVTTTYAINIISRNEIIDVRTTAALEKVILPDGTIVWLKEQSTLSYPEEFEGNTRNISFTGEALFEVAKDPEHPFIIQYGEYSATVLGTSFNLSTRSVTHLHLSVLTGKVRLTSATDTEGVTITPNRSVIYNGREIIAETIVQETEKDDLIENTQYNMLFKDARMKDIFKKLEDKFNVTVVPDNDAINNCFMTGDFTDQSLNETLGALAKTLGFEYEVSDKKVKIKGEGCQ